MKCEKCNKEHDGRYGSGRFCSALCARSFSTQKNRKLTNEKISKALTGRKLSEEHKTKISETWERKLQSINGLHFRSNTLSLEYNLINFFVKNSKSTNQKIKNRLFLLRLKDNKCEKCNIVEYNNQPITLQLHHINGIHNDNRLSNLQILCPNCHSQTENYAGKRR